MKDLIDAVEDGKVAVDVLEDKLAGMKKVVEADMKRGKMQKPHSEL